MPRRLRVRRETALTGDNKSALSKKINKYVALQQQQKEIAVNMADIQEEVDYLMKQYGVRRHATPKAVAEYKTPQGRSTTIIRNREFIDLVGNQVFMDIAKVGITEAKKHVSGKELKKVSTTVPPKEKDPVLVIKAK